MKRWYLINKFFEIILIVLVLNMFAIGQNRSWFAIVEKIMPGVTTRSDILKMFPGIKEDNVNRFDSVEDVYYHSHETGRLSVSYSTGRCAGRYALSIESDVVYSFSFWPEKPINIRRTGIDLTGFSVSRESDTENWIYSNVTMGATYTVFENKKLSGISAGLSKDQEARLSCLKRQD